MSTPTREKVLLVFYGEIVHIGLISIRSICCLDIKLEIHSIQKCRYIFEVCYALFLAFIGIINCWKFLKNYGTYFQNEFFELIFFVRAFEFLIFQLN